MSFKYHTEIEKELNKSNRWRCALNEIKATWPSLVCLMFIVGFVFYFGFVK